MRKIIVDTLGADMGSEPIITGALRALKENTEIGMVFVGVKDDILRYAEKADADMDRIEIIETDKFVSNTDLPTCVFNGADETSMVMTLENLKKNDEIVGMISAGNTGALLVGTICRLGLIPGLRTPVLATAIPCKKDGLVCLVDCGANTECVAEDLKRFALMGNAFMQSLTGNENPKVALMSVGRTRHKGTNLVKEAYGLIEKLPLNFIGNIEGNDMVGSEADVIVTDGFTGNILLKNTEAAGMIAINAIDSLGTLSPELQKVRDELYDFFAFNDRGGAVFLGTRKAVVKMHGCANQDTAYACVNLAIKLEDRNFSSHVAASLNV